MDFEIASNLKIVLMITIGFAFAGIFGYIFYRLKLSPIIGYLLAGYIIGPYSPGFVADMQVSEQLAEIGVILMMFGVGLHFSWRDLMGVRKVAIPGAIGQTVTSTLAAAFILYYLGWGITASSIVGFAVGVASTVVLVRMLADNNLLHTREGHIAIGWLIVEDLLTVFALLLLPMFVGVQTADGVSASAIAESVGLVILKFLVLGLFMFTAGRWLVSRILMTVARTRSDELLTLTVLALIFVIATGSTIVFGTSIALGAFIAGMAVGQTHVKHQALANALPLKDAFAVIFFLAVGMLFNPVTVFEHFSVFIWLLAIILIVKPLAAWLIMIVMRYPFKTSLTVALALAQIGEFSFILVEEASKLHLIADEGYDVIIACAIVSITINPLFFMLLNRIQARKPEAATDPSPSVKPDAIVVGYGPVGRTATKLLEDAHRIVANIDQNVDTATKLAHWKPKAVFGDATAATILKAAGISSATLIIITIPNVASTLAVIRQARHLNPTITIFARATYQSDCQKLRDLGAEVICQETEVSDAFVSALRNWVDRNPRKD
ncbi:MAG: cation:proton antiporter [Chlamydiales bacterium]|nr:cation:proton antiporter [Chlamydiales bacterium]